MAVPPAPTSVRNLYSNTKQPTTSSTPFTSTANASSSSGLGSGLSSTLAGVEIDPTDPEDSLTFSDIAQLFASEFLTTAMGMPFEVGKTLLQVEYKPKEGVVPDGSVVPEHDPGNATIAEMTDDESVLDDGEQGSQRIFRNTEASITNPEEAEAYFQDVIQGGSRPFAASTAEDDAEPVDQAGYLPEASPKYVLKTDVSPSGTTGVWGMMRRIRRTPSEGLPALWKGQLITTIHSVLSNNIQPIVHTFLLISLPPAVARVELNAELELPLTSHPHPALPLGLHVAAHLLTHVFLSPLELLKTRLIVQPSSLPESKSSLSLLRDAVNREGGFTGLYLHSHLIIPAILEHTLRPVLTLSIPLLIERQLNITPDVSPVTYSMLDLGLGLASLLVILPVETVRKRLQLQDRSFVDEDEDEDVLARKHQRKSIVRLRTKPYHGVVEAIWRIITEETTAVPRKRRRKSRGAESVAVKEGAQGGRFDGVRQLYRGFGMAAGAHLTVFALGLVSAGLGGRSVEYGWQEI
ncbi:hypothetical protein QFC21_001547 [Naganishia friedmannii]|uniref:Uncharacterized protein n=1 Tax=Naganishia friedmannii TaxID=89922 RepID=A0ACC2W4Q4_9TREE|nr:hypothetical protein QFC21_001547 [Naganishia friedmannii]